MTRIRALILTVVILILPVIFLLSVGYYVGGEDNLSALGKRYWRRLRRLWRK